MQNGIHFISGLPRSGSTLLAALLRQNPRFSASMTSPVGGFYTAMLSEFAQRSEFAAVIDDNRRRALLRGLFESYYADVHPHKLVFDTNRLWCAKLSGLAELYPAAKVVCCVRHLGWIADSVERIAQRLPFAPSRMFGGDAGGTVYSRVDQTMGASGFVGFGFNAMKEAFYGRFADRLILMQYDSLTRQPRESLAALYEALREPAFEHDFDNVSFEEGRAFDESFGVPGLHDIRPKVAKEDRATILPPDIFRRFENDSFWRDPQLNINDVKVI